MLAPVLARRIRAGTLVAGGLAVAAAGCALLTLAGDGLASVVAAHVVLSIGLGPVVTLSTDLVVSAAPEERAGAAAAISETGSELGGALGIALLGSLGTAVYRSELTGAPPLGSVPDGLLDAAGDAFTSGVQAVGLATAAILLAMAAVAATRLSPRSRRRPTTQLP
jgi:DHA2 family multidrug resistance protein-like MFS transporter